MVFDLRGFRFFRKAQKTNIEARTITIRCRFFGPEIRRPRKMYEMGIFHRNSYTFVTLFDRKYIKTNKNWT